MLVMVGLEDGNKRERIGIYSRIIKMQFLGNFQIWGINRFMGDGG